MQYRKILGLFLAATAKGFDVNSGDRRKVTITDEVNNLATKNPNTNTQHLDKGYYATSRPAQKNYELKITFDEFYQDVAFSTAQKVKEKIVQLEKSDAASIARGNRPENLWRFFTEIHPGDKFSILMVAVDQGKNDIVSEILNTALKHERLLEVIINQQADMLKIGAFYMAVYNNNVEIVRTFLEIVKQNAPSLTDTLFSSYDRNTRASEVRLAILRDYYDIFCCILDSITITYQHSVLLDYDANNMPIIHLAVAYNRLKMLKKVLEIDSGYRDLEADSIWQDSHIAELIIFASSYGHNDITSLFLDYLIKYDSDLAIDLINHFYSNPYDVSFINSLILSGNIEAIEKLHYLSPNELECSPVQNGLITKIPKILAYYVEARNQGMRYFTQDEEGKSLVEVSINEIKATNEDLLIIKSPDLQKSILVSDFVEKETGNQHKDFIAWLKDQINSANKYDASVIVSTIEADNFDSMHTTTLTLNKNAKTQKWNAELHDPGVGTAEHRKSTIVAMQDIVRSKLLPISTVKEVRHINNFADELAPDGYCDSIGYIYGAAKVIGGKTFEDLKKECRTLGDKCAKTLIQRWNPKISNILEGKLEYMIEIIENKREIEEEKNQESWTNTLKDQANTQHKHEL